MTRNSSDVLIVGAGPAGLAVGAVLRRAGISALILEQADCVGSKWHTHYERLHLHTAKRLSELPYLLFPDDYPTYPSRLQVIKYLETYAQQFELDIRFGQQITSVSYDGTFWQASTAETVYTAPYLVMATGYNDQPIVPTWPGQASFAGTMLHTAEYRNGEPFWGQDVLVIGFGNSGAEIALDLWEHGARPGISVRSPVNVVFRDRFGVPAQLISILLNPFPPWLADVLTAPALRIAYGDLGRYGLKKLPYGPATQGRIHHRIPVIDVGTIKLMRDGKLKVYPDVREFTAKGVIFVDSTEKHFDSVVFATGFRSKLPSIVKEISGLVADDGYPLVSGRETALPGLYFCGLHNAFGGLLREIGIEAQRIGKSIAEKRGRSDSAKIR